MRQTLSKQPERDPSLNMYGSLGDGTFETRATPIPAIEL